MPHIQLIIDGDVVIDQDAAKVTVSTHRPYSWVGPGFPIGETYVVVSN